jgi:hypothetical protein
MLAFISFREQNERMAYTTLAMFQRNTEKIQPEELFLVFLLLVQAGRSRARFPMRTLDFF